MASKNTAKGYNDQSIKALKGADRVRKRPAVIFGSDGLDGCQHAVFEILSKGMQTCTGRDGLHCRSCKQRHLRVPLCNYIAFLINCTDCNYCIPEVGICLHVLVDIALRTTLCKAISNKSKDHKYCE